MVAPALLITVTFALPGLRLVLAESSPSSSEYRNSAVNSSARITIRHCSAIPVARQALLVTLGFVLVSTLLELVCGLMIALVIHERFRGRGLVRRHSHPRAIPTVVASQLWRYIFNDRYGLANLLWFGDRVTDYVPWLAYPHRLRDCGPGRRGKPLPLPRS